MLLSIRAVRGRLLPLLAVLPVSRSFLSNLLSPRKPLPLSGMSLISFFSLRNL